MKTDDPDPLPSTFNREGGRTVSLMVLDQSELNERELEEILGEDGIIRGADNGHALHEPARANGKNGKSGDVNGTRNGKNGHARAKNGAATTSNGHTHRAAAVVHAPSVPRVTHAEPEPIDHVIGPKARELMRRAFPEATDREWSDWKWQLRNRIKDVRTLERVITLTDDERTAAAKLGWQVPVGITPHYAALIRPEDPACPIRKTMVPTSHEFTHAPGEAEDPLGEDADMPVPGLVHRYPDRVLFLVTSFCATYCRYCTRSRLVGKTGEYHFNQAQYERALQYLETATTVRDVLISGGDPLTMADDRIEWLLSRLRAIKHIEFIRIGSKIPCVLPQRITTAFCRMVKKYHPFWLSVHFMHPDEITPEVAQACERLADHGVPLGSQTVLTAGVNDDVATMKRLSHELLKIRVRPYYIYQCDPIPGSSHFRTPVEKGLEIIEGLRGHTTGYAVPSYVIDAPGGGGKIPLLPQYYVGRDGDEIILRNFEGKTYRYPDPIGR